MAELLESLPPLQEKVVRLYFGLGCRRSHSALEIARELQVSPQVIAGLLGAASQELSRAGLTREELREAARAVPPVSSRGPKCRHRF